MESAGDVALYAGVTSALQYYANQHNWAVLRISWANNSAAYQSFLEENYTLDFSGLGKTQSVKYQDTGIETDSPRKFATLHGVDLGEFNRLNENPQDVKSTAERKKIPWMHYPMIKGQTVAAPGNTELIQVKFNGAGLTLLNTPVVVTKSVAVTGNTYKDQATEAAIATRVSRVSLGSPKRGIEQNFPIIFRAITGAVPPATAATGDFC
jgi:hypothetical protein